MHGRRLILPVLAVALAGCGSAPEASGGIQPVGGAPSIPTVTVSTEAPRLDDGTLGILVKDGSEKVQVGMNEDRALEIFKSPSNVLLVDSLPKGVPAETYSPGGWETIDETSGFGFIAVKNTKQIAVAIRTRRFEVKDDADAEVQLYQNAFETIADHSSKEFSITGQSTYNYWFWQEGDNRLMVLEGPQGKRWQVTAMLGQKSLMDALRASMSAAQQDMVRLDSMRKDAGPTKGESSAPK